MISIVIPTLNAATALPATLAALAPGRDSGLISEILISDGGSDDDTARLAKKAGVTVITGRRAGAGNCNKAP